MSWRFFGAPVALEDHALRAVEAALEIQESMVASAGDLQAQFGVTPGLRLGLNTGRVVVGKIGDDLRMDYTAQGDTVNLASRLQAVAQAGTVAISAATKRLVAGDVECVALGSHVLKGKATPVEVFQPIRVVGRGARLAVSAEQLITPFVGRDAELGRLLVLFHEVRAGQSRIVTVIGEAGIGKSRLLLEFKHRIGNLRVRWFVGRCVPYGRSTPYRPIVEILRAMLDFEGDDSEDVASAKLDERLAELGDQERKLAPALRYMLAIGAPDPGLSLLSPPERKAAITSGIDGVLMASTMREPHVFIFEGCQWLDPASEEYLIHVLQHNLPGPVLLILTSRPGDAGRPALTAGERITLEALTPSESWGLVTPMATDDLPVDLLTSTVDRTGGNPLFIEEVVRGLVETGSETIPPTVEDVLMARVDRLLPPLKSTLQTASVIGQEFGRLPLERVVDAPSALAPVLGNLLGLSLITEIEPLAAVYRFKQPLLQEVAYEGLLSQYRKVTHRAIGKAFEELYPNRLSEHFEELARHFTLAEEWPAALLYHREAGRKAVALCANVEAAERFQQALELLDRLPESSERTGQAIDIRLELCPPVFQLGRLEDVLRLSTEAESLAQMLAGRATARTGVLVPLQHPLYESQPDLAIDYGHRCLRIEDVPGTATTERNVRQYLGTSSHVMGQYRAAEEVLARHIELLDADDDFLRVGQANLSYVSSCGWLAFTFAELGEFPRAHQCAAKGMHAASVAGHAYVEAIASTFAGLVWQAQGEIDRALPLLEGSLDTCRTHQLVVWRPVTSAILGQAYVVVGQVDTGLQLLSEAVSLTAELGVYAYRSLWEVLLAEGFLAAGQITPAFEIAQSALDLAVRHKEQGNHAKALPDTWACRLASRTQWVRPSRKVSPASH